MNSTAFDTHLVLKDENGTVAWNNTYNGNVNAKIIYTVESGHAYTIEALSSNPFVTGSYTITLAVSNGRRPSGRRPFSF